MLKSLAFKGLVGMSCLLAATGMVGCGNMDNHSAYVIDVNAPEQITVNQQVSVDVTLKADEVRDLGYDRVLIRVDVSDKDNLQLKATDTQSQEWDVSQVGYWGPPTGFAISNDYDVTTTFRATAKQAGSYTITMNLVDLDNDEAVLTTKTITVNAING